MSKRRFVETLDVQKSVRFSASEIKNLNAYCKRKKLRLSSLMRFQTLKALENEG